MFGHVDGFSISHFSEMAQGSKSDGAKYFQTKVNFANFVISPKMFDLNGAISQIYMVHMHPLHLPYATPVFSYQFQISFFCKKKDKPYIASKWYTCKRELNVHCMCLIVFI